MKIALDRIRVGKRLRSLREPVLPELMGSIAELGLQVPVTVASGIEKREGGGQDLIAYDLIAGAHRLEACRRLGWDEIEASVVLMTPAQRELWEIDENLQRADLTELERGEHLARRKVVYEKAHPGTQAGAAQAAGMNRAIGNNVNDKLSPTFAADTATKTGMDKRSVQRAIRRVNDIPKEVRDRIRNNPEIADSGVELDALAALDLPEQRKAVALVEAGQAVGIRAATKIIEPKKPKPNFKPEMAADEKWWQQFVTLMSKASEANRQRAREHLDEPVANNAAALRVVS